MSPIIAEHDSLTAMQLPSNEILTTTAISTKMNADYSNLKLEEKIAVCEPFSEVNLLGQQLTDRDMETVIGQVIIKKQCTALWLEYNEITSQGTSLLAGALYNNTTLEKLSLHNNRVSDMGVHSLAQALSFDNSTLKELDLSWNGITDEGAQHLAEMLMTNKTLSRLNLSENQITDQGVQMLAIALAHHNTTLKRLDLETNKLMSDSCIDSLVEILEHNRSLVTLDVRYCNLSEARLREVSKPKKGFDLLLC